VIGSHFFSGLGFGEGGTLGGCEGGTVDGGTTGGSTFGHTHALVPSVGSTPSPQLFAQLPVLHFNDPLDQSSVHGGGFPDGFGFGVPVGDCVCACAYVANATKQIRKREQLFLII